jgi:hypothetical protein
MAIFVDAVQARPGPFTVVQAQTGHPASSVVGGWRIAVVIDAAGPRGARKCFSVDFPSKCAW